MDGASTRRTGSRGRRPVRRAKHPTRGGGAEGDQRRLIQLAVSLALFLLVYVGRGVFPAQLEAWQEAAAANVDFKGAFQQFGAALSQGAALPGALEALCVNLLGGEAEPEPSLEPDTQKPEPPTEAPTLLSQTREIGRAHV